MVYRVWAESISDVYVDIEADCEEDAIEVAEYYLDGGDFIDSGHGDWRIGSAYEIDTEPMFNANDFLSEEDN